MSTDHSAKEQFWNLGMLAMVVFVYATLNLQRTSIPGAVFNELQMDFSASASAISAIGAVFMYTYAVAQLMAGPVVDQFGGVRAILGGGAVFILGSLLFPFGKTLLVVNLSRFLIGLGAGMIYLSMVKLLDRLFPKQFSLVLGLALFLGYSGSILGGYPLVKAVSRFSWRICFIAIGAASLAGYLLIWLCRSRVTLPPVNRGHISFGPILQTMKTHSSRVVLISTGFSFGLYYMMLVVAGKKFLEDCSGTSAALASTALSIMVVISAGGNFVSGLLSTLWGNRRKPFLLAAVGAPLLGAVMGLAGLFFHAGSWWNIIVLLLFAMTSCFSPVTSSLMREVNPPQNTGAAVCFQNFLAYVSVAVYANLAGLFMDWFAFGNAVRGEHSVTYPVSSYAAIFILSLIVSAITFIAALFVPETKGENLYGKVK